MKKGEMNRKAGFTAVKKDAVSAPKVAISANNTVQGPMRLQKMLASAGVASRRQSEEWIAAGRVQVNGQVIREMGFQVTAQDRVVVDGKPIAGPEELVYILLYKPTGCVTTTSDPYDRKKVTDFVTGVKARLFPVGRLDYETDGALILTNDGELANRLMHPRFGVTKAYQAVVQGQMTAETIAILERGVLLDGEMTAPSQAVMLGTDGKTTKIEIRIHEGRNRQVRRMLEAVRHPVLSLTRVAYGPLSLRGLRPGTWRHLTEYEVQLLQTPPAPAQKPREKGPRKRRS